MLKHIYTYCFLMVMFSAKAQVESFTYKLMLNTMLSHSVVETDVKSASKAQNVLYLDARELNEYKVSHIENAKFVGYEKFDLKLVEGIAKNQKIIVYCSVGYRSEKIAEKLNAAGFTQVANLYGGIFEWVNQNQAIVDQKNQKTTRVHAFSKTWGIWLNKGVKVYE